jgi:hypothetical protein
MEILTLGIVGVIVSGIVQRLKTKYETSKDETLLMVAGVSVLAGLAYYFIERAELIQTTIMILGIANTFYSFVVKRFEE